MLYLAAGIIAVIALTVPLESPVHDVAKMLGSALVGCLAYQASRRGQ